MQLAFEYFGASGFGRVWVQYFTVLYGSGPTSLGSSSAPGQISQVNMGTVLSFWTVVRNGSDPGVNFSEPFGFR